MLQVEIKFKYSFSIFEQIENQKFNSDGRFQFSFALASMFLPCFTVEVGSHASILLTQIGGII